MKKKITSFTCSVLLLFSLSCTQQDQKVNQEQKVTIINQPAVSTPSPSSSSTNNPTPPTIPTSSSPPATPTPSSSPTISSTDLTGTWRGSYIDYSLYRTCTITINLTQTNNKITGLATNDCGALGNLSGEINENQVVIYSSDGAIFNGFVSGNTMTGTIVNYLYQSVDIVFTKQ